MQIDTDRDIERDSYWDIARPVVRETNNKDIPIKRYTTDFIIWWFIEYLNQLSSNTIIIIWRKKNNNNLFH